MSKFVRKSSGLVREIGAKDAFSMNFSFLGPAAGVAYPLSFAAVILGSNWLVATIIGGLIMLPVTFLYYYLSTVIPRSGGDYVYISRILGPRIGMIQAIANLFVFSVGVPILAQLELPLVLEPSLQILGVTFHDSGLVSFAQNLSFSNEGSPIFFGLTVVIIAFASLVSMLRTKVFASVVTWLTVVQIVGTAVMIVGILSVRDYASAFNSVSASYGGPTYSSLTEKVGPFNLLQTLVLMSAITSFLFLYNNAPTFFGGEVKSPKRSMFYGQILSYVVSALMAILLVFGLQYVIGEGFYDYTSVNGWTTSNGNGIPIVPTSLLSYVAIPFLNNPAVIVVMVLSAITWYILYAILNVAIPSRTLFSMSFDWLAPSFFSKVSERLRTPVYSVLFVFLAALFFDYLEIYQGFSVGVLSDIVIYIVYQYFIAAIAAVVLGRKRMYGVDGKLGRKLVIAGSLSAVCLALPAILLIGYGVYYSPFGSQIFSGNEVLNLSILVGLPISALVIFEAVKRIRMKQGIDISLTFKEIPPE